MNHADAGSAPNEHAELAADAGDVLVDVTQQLETAENVDPAESVEILAAVTSILNAELEADQGES